MKKLIKVKFLAIDFFIAERGGCQAKTCIDFVISRSLFCYFWSLKTLMMRVLGIIIFFKIMDFQYHQRSNTQNHLQ